MPSSGSTNRMKCELKIAQFKACLTTYLRIQALAERAEFVRLLNDEISDEISRFAIVQSNSIA